MARPSNKQRRLAELYVSGPEYLRGDWTRCSVAAGFEEPPARDDAIMVNLVAALGGTITAEDANAEPPEFEPAEPAEAPAADSVIGELFQAREKGIPWSQMQSKLSDVIESVANGTVRATAAQVSMLKFIIAEAKADAAAAEANARYVLILPTQGIGPAMRIDPTEQIKELARVAQQR